MPSPLVSVIVPSYNHGHYICQTLQSIANQTYANIELLVIDDGSTDGSVDITQHWAHSHWNKKGRFEIVGGENKGAHAAINKGIELSRGTFISILNSDDFYHPKRIEKLILQSGKKKDTLTFTRVEAVDEKGKFFEPSLFLGPWYPQILNSSHSAAAKILSANVAVTSGNFFFNKSLIKKTGYFRPWRLVHDYDFALRAALLANVEFIDETLLYYRVHSNNTISKDRYAYGHEVSDMAYDVLTQYLLHEKTNRPFHFLAKDISHFETCWLKEWIGPSTFNKFIEQ